MRALVVARGGTSSTSPGTARSPEPHQRPRHRRLLHQTLLVGAASTGLWFAGALGHAASADAATATAARPAPVVAVAAQPTRNSLVRTAHSAIQPATDQTVANAVASGDAAVPVLAVPVLAVPVLAVPVVAMPIVAVPIVAMPAILPGIPVVNLPNGQVATARQRVPALAVRVATHAGPVLLAMPPAAGSPSTRRAELASQPDRTSLPPRPAPTVPTGTLPGIGDTAGGDSTALELLAPDPCPGGHPLGLPGRPGRRAQAPHERATAPAVAPD